MPESAGSTPFNPFESDTNGRPLMSPSMPAALADQPSAIAIRLQRLTMSVTDEDSLLELMFRIADEAVWSMPGVDFAGVSTQFDGGPFTMAHTHNRVLVVDERQYQTDDGPCLRSLRTRQRVLMSVDEVARQWPELGQTARDAGVAMFLALPAAAYQVIPAASLNLYSSDPTAFAVIDENTVTVLSNYLARGITEYCNLQYVMGSSMRLRSVIEQQRLINVATGVLMALDQSSTIAKSRDEVYLRAQRHHVSPVAEAEAIVADHTA